MSRFWCAAISSEMSSRPSSRSRSSQSASRDHVVLELADERLVDVRVRAFERRLALRHEVLRGAELAIEAIAHAAERLAQRIGRVRIFVVRGGERAELRDRLAQRVIELLARRGVLAGPDQPASEVVHELLGERLLARQGLLVALARRDHAQVQLARPADVRAADVVGVLGLDPVAHVAAARHGQLGDVPQDLALRAHRAVELERLLAVVLARFPHELGRREPEVILDDVRELDAPQVRHVERIGGRHQLHRRRPVGLGLDRARQGLDRARAVGRCDREAIARRLVDRERRGELIAVELGGQRARGRAVGRFEHELGGLCGDEHARAQCDLRAGQAAQIARRRRQLERRALRVRRERQHGVEIADERHDRERGAVERRGRRGQQARPAIGDLRRRDEHEHAIADERGGEPAARAADLEARHELRGLDGRELRLGRDDERGDERGRGRAGPRGRARELDRGQEVARDRRVPRADPAGERAIRGVAPARRDRARHDRKARDAERRERREDDDRDHHRARAGERVADERQHERERGETGEPVRERARRFVAIDERPDARQKPRDRGDSGGAESGPCDGHARVQHSASHPAAPCGPWASR